MRKAQQVCGGRLVHNDKASWNSLVTSHVKNGELWQAHALYEETQIESVLVYASTWAALLKACAKLKKLDTGLSIHAEVARSGLFESDVFIGSTLIDMYAKCGSLGKAQDAFDDLLVQNTVSWTALVAAYLEAGYDEDALFYFEQMQQYDDISVDAVTYMCGLKACARTQAIGKGREMHEKIITRGFEGYLSTGSALVDMYAKCGLLEEAHVVFDNLHRQDVVAWTALIGGYADCGLGQEALSCFEVMKHKRISPDAGTFVCCLQACASIKAPDKGQELYGHIAKVGLDGNVVVGGALVDLLAKCGSLTEARFIFDRLPVHNVVLWTIIMTGYVDFDLGEEAFDCYDQMEREGIAPVSATYVCALKGCGSIGAIKKGRKLHSDIVKKGFETEILVGNTLVDMYAKCGWLAEAHGVFIGLESRSLISWTALITGYAQLGDSNAVFDMFDRVLQDGMIPNLVTVLNVLNVCSHSGLLAEGLMCFDYASREYDLIPNLSHYTCIVDLLGRAGNIEKAVLVIQKIPYHPGVGLWLSVLGACRKWGNIELGMLAFEHATRLDKQQTEAYIGMVNIYANALFQDDAA